MSVQLSLQRTHSQQSNDPQTNSTPLRVDQARVNQVKDGHRSLIRSSASPASLFHSIPPERVGLQGEYDHHGLVNLALSTTGAADVEVNGVIIGDSFKNYLEVKPNPELLQQLQPLVES